VVLGTAEPVEDPAQPRPVQPVSTAG
jgi:hypothetical protein